MKIPVPQKSGFWPMEAEARTDHSMLLGLLFPPIVGAGAWSIDASVAKRKAGQTSGWGAGSEHEFGAHF
jgi:hypothetical protein